MLSNEEKCDLPFRCDCTINGRPCSQEIPDELLEQGEPPILVHQDPVVVDEEDLCLTWRWISALWEGVRHRALVHHLVTTQ